MPNISAAKVSTAGKEQCLALIKEHLNQQLKMDKNRAGKANIRFKNGPFIELLGTISVITPFGQIDFHVIKINTLFLISIKNMDRFSIYFNNVIN